MEEAHAICVILKLQIWFDSRISMRYEIANKKQDFSLYPYLLLRFDCQKLHRILVHSPLHSIDYECSDTAYSEAAKEGTNALISVDVSRYLHSSSPCFCTWQ